MDIIEGGYSSIMDNLIEMKGLATQAANDTFSATERTLIAKQIQSLGYDINDIADSTKFNGIALNPSAADGGDGTLTFQTGEGTSDTYTFNLRQVDILSLFGNTSLDSAGSDIVSAANQALLSGADADNDDRGEIDFTIAVLEAAEAGTGTATEVDALATDFRDLMTAVDAAVATLNGYMNEIGIDQRSMSGKEVNLTEAISANSAAKSRIMDVDFAKEQSNSVRLQILQQTATAALSQANMGPQAVLGFLGQ
jgi:flagellin